MVNCCKTIRYVNLVAVLSVALICSFMIPTLGFTQDYNTIQRDKAFNSIDVATQLVDQAQKIISMNPNSIDGLKTALHLYIEAGQKFEVAAKVFEHIGPEYVSQQDFEGTIQAVNMCVTSIKEIQERVKMLSQAQYDRRM